MGYLRQFWHWAAPTTTYRVVFAAVALLGIVLCFVPLFDLVGYESAALTGVVVGLAVPFLTLHSVARGLVDPPLDDTRVTSPTRDFLVMLARHELLLVPPAAALGLNALRVTNCDIAVGLGFWLAIPVFSVSVGQAIGWLAAGVTDRGRWQVAIVAAVVLGSAAWFGLHLALQPPITGHQLLLGYFSGSIYDEALALPESLVWYRVLCAAGVLVVLSAIELGWAARQGRDVRWIVVVVALFATVFAGLWWFRQDLGIGLDRDYIQAELGGRLETEHFVIHYAPNSRFIEQLDLLAEDHEYRYDELAEMFGTDPAADNKIHSYVYPNRATKGELMGARRTLVAKIWLEEIHIIWRDYGDHLLAHELAHVFTEPFAAGPLRLSMQQGIGVNMGLVEGVATAADWPIGDLSPHEASAALRRMDRAPDITGLVGASGFWTQSSGRAYTMMGSFIRFLIERYGIDKLKRAYPHGELEEVYGKSPEALVDEWEAFVDGLELTGEQMALARYYYDRRSIFEKVCARTIAELRRRADEAASRGDVGEARRLYERIVGFAPDNVGYRIEYAQALEEAREYRAALDMIDGLLERELPPVKRARLEHLRGDLYWRLETPQKASQAYQSCLREGLPTSLRRLLEVKRDVVEHPVEQVRGLAFEYLMGENPSAVELFFPMQWYRDHPDPLAAYLIGRRLWSARLFEQARRYLEDAEEGLDSGVLLSETRLMLGQVDYFTGRLDEAESAFSTLQQDPRTRYRMAGEEWLARIAWKRRNR